VFCAAPRFLDAALLRHVLQLPSDLEARERWNRYHRFTFMRPIDDEQMVFHPLVRRLLLRRLFPDPEPASDYRLVHQRLQAYFERCAAKGDDSAWVEEAYHALALGDPGPAINLGVLAQRSRLALWEPLLEVVAQAPYELMPEDIEQQAYRALAQTEQQHDVQDAVTAIVLKVWLLSAFQETPEEAAGLWHNLGTAYRNLPGGDRQANLERAIAYYEAALEVFKLARMVFYMQVVDGNLRGAREHLRELEQGYKVEKWYSTRCYAMHLQYRYDNAHEPAFYCAYSVPILCPEKTMRWNCGRLCKFSDCERWVWLTEYGSR